MYFYTFGSLCFCGEKPRPLPSAPAGTEPTTRENTVTSVIGDLPMQTRLIRGTVGGPDPFPHQNIGVGSGLDPDSGCMKVKYSQRILGGSEDPNGV